jgi:sugar/nucleoside kinase (ribokinase family)
LVGLVDWCNLVHASNIWRGVLEDIIKPSVDHQPYFFFDLADPSKKSTDEVVEVIEIINSFSAYGKVTLGLNENETIRLAGFLGLSTNLEDGKELLLSLGRNLFDYMDIDRLLIHPIDGCLSINRSQEYSLPGRVVVHPKVSTGGGDNFNAGFCFGLLNGFTDMESMVCAMATSGAYVQNGASPDLSTLITYMESWSQGQ